MVNSFDEWSPLQEVIVGSPISYDTQELELSFKLFFHDVAFANMWFPYYETTRNKKDDTEHKVTPVHKVSKQILEELAEDVDELARTLEKEGVLVHRPLVLKEAIQFKTPYWESTMIPALNIRDQAIIMGNEIIETPPQVRARYFENDLLKPVFYRYFQAGARWATMPKPIMTDRSFDMSYVSSDKAPLVEKVYAQNQSDFDIGYEMMFDAAQCIRFGRDILVNIATENHALGVQWLERHLEGKFKFHKVYRMADNHIDSIVLPLKPGTLLLRHPRFLNLLPAPLQKWDIIYPPEPKDNIFPSYESNELILTTKYIDLNVLSIDKERVIVNALFPELVDTLEKHGFTPIPVRHRHRRLFGGGFHCFTLDTVRAGGPDDYFS